MTRQRDHHTRSAEQLHIELAAWCNDRLAPDDSTPMALAMLHIAASLLCLELGDDAEAIAFIKRALDRRLATTHRAAP